MPEGPWRVIRVSDETLGALKEQKKALGLDSLATPNDVIRSLLKLPPRVKRYSRGPKWKSEHTRSGGV